MSKKSIREMNATERAHNSLAARVFHATLMGSVVLGVLSLIIGLTLYIGALAGQYITETYQLSRNAAAALVKMVDITPMADRTMKIYHGLSEEEAAKTGTEEYREKFKEICDMPEYKTALAVLNTFLEGSDVSDLYIAMYDAEHSALVYIVDPDEESDYIFKPGDWESVDKDEVEKFLKWNGEGQLYDIGNTDKYGWMCTAGVPVKSGDGEIVAFVLSDITLKNMIYGARHFFFQYLISITIATIILATIMSLHMKKSLVKPINAIAGAAENYVNDRRSGSTETNHFAALDIRTGDEVENLGLVMADMERELNEYVNDLTKVTAEKERVSTELNMATQIQEGMLPNIYPAFPDRSEFDIYATMDPAKEVGGDFYDFFLVDDDHLCMVIADVSGKGVPAALFMMASKIIIANNAMMAKSPAKILEDTNASICSNNRLDMFVTVWLGILEISTGKITAANAGHEFPTVRHADGKFELFKDKHGFVIGGMKGVKYNEYEIMLEPGAKLFVYTDGVPEATNGDGAMFGAERMIEALNEEPDASPVGILKNVKKAVTDFVEDAEQFDDLTMLCLEYKGTKTEEK